VPERARLVSAPAAEEEEEENGAELVVESCRRLGGCDADGVEVAEVGGGGAVVGGMDLVKVRRERVLQTRSCRSWPCGFDFLCFYGELHVMSRAKRC
jgi:hypothetical protein